MFRKWCSCVVPVLCEGFTDVANLLFVHSPREVNGVYGLIIFAVDIILGSLETGYVRREKSTPQKDCDK